MSSAAASLHQIPLNYSDPPSFFYSASEAFQRAGSNSPGFLDRFFSLGKYSVRFRFAGDALVPPVTRAFAHLVISGAPPTHLTLNFWDAVSTGVAMPAPFWKEGDFLIGGEIRGLSNARYQAFYQMDSGILAVIDLEGNIGYCWYRSSHEIPDYELAAPLRLPLYPWLMRHGLLPVHAGAVGFRQGGVLLAGKSGTGKSNTAMACLRSELGYASDDFCLVDPSTLEVHSLYSTSKIHARDLERFPGFRERIGNPDRASQDKSLFFLYEHFPQQVLTHFPLRAIFIPRFGNRNSPCLVTASPAAALAALTPGTTLLMPSAAQTTFRGLADLVRRLPAFYLDLPRDTGQIPSEIAAFLRANGYPRAN